MAETKVLLVARVDPALHAEVEALASAELDGNTSMMVRRLLREAVDARSAGSRPVGPAEVVAQALVVPVVTPTVQPGRIARPPAAKPVFSQPERVAAAAEWLEGLDPDDPEVSVQKPVRAKAAKADRMPTSAELRLMAKQKGR